MEGNWLGTVISSLLILVSGIGLAGLTLYVWSSLYIVRVVSQSMFPTLKEGDRVLVWRLGPRTWLRRGQVVLVWPWMKRTDNPWGRSASQAKFSPYIKRLVALEGDTLVTRLSDLTPKEHESVLSEHDSTGKRVWHIPPGHIFVRGDNRPAVNDSLLWGSIPDWTVMGIVLIKLSFKAPRIGRQAEYKGSVPKGDIYPLLSTDTLSGSK
jgi:signal peptidase I